MSAVEEILRSHLLFNKHRALIVLNGQRHEINSTKTKSTVKSSDGSSLVIRYDGYKFFAEDVSGAVCANNYALQKNTELPNSCVISFGASGSGRTFVTFDVSNPEVMP